MINFNPLIFLKFLLLSCTVISEKDADIVVLAVEIPGMNTARVEGINWFSGYEERFKLLQRNEQSLNLYSNCAEENILRKNVIYQNFGFNNLILYYDPLEIS